MPAVMQTPIAAVASLATRRWIDVEQAEGAKREEHVSRKVQT